MADAS
jgi:hypothetical protein